MNFVAHSVVAVRSGMDEADQILGAVLGDLSAMARIRFDVGRLPPGVADGVRLHWAADRAFHADRAFLAGADALRASASSAGIAAGRRGRSGTPAGSCSSTDSLPLTPMRAWWRRLRSPRPCPPCRATDGDAGSWGRLAARMTADRWWHRYADPGFVAERLFDMLSRRPRLAFDRSQMPAVAEVLAHGQPSVATEAAALLARVVTRVQAEGH